MKHMYRPKSPPVCGVGALRLGLQGGWSHAVCETEVSETEGGNGRGENTEEGPKELVAF